MDAYNVAEFITSHRGVSFFNVTVRTSGASVFYSNMKSIEEYCSIERDEFGEPIKIKILAQGKDGRGPYVFLFPPEEGKLDQCACLGMFILELSVPDED